MSTIGFTFEHAGQTQDSLWTAVDAYAFPHSHPSTRPNHKALENALVASKAAGLPEISASPAQAKFMALQCRMLKVTHALEVGTLGGYTAIWLASENPQLKVVSIEYDPDHVKVARKNIESAGLSDRIEVIQGKGTDVLRILKEEVLTGKRERFGFTFIDANKEDNWNYLDLAADMSKPGALFCVDNVVRGGKIIDFSNKDERLMGSRAAIENAGKDPRFDSVVIQSVGEKSYDGALWVVLKE